MALLVTAGVSDDVAQEELMPSRLATIQDPGTPDQIVLNQHSQTHFPSQPWCKVESRGRDSVENRRRGATT